jgi:Uma2 family endonuclease
VTATGRLKHHYDFAAYLRLCEDSSVRLEYWDGQIYAMAGGSVEHSRLSARIVSLLDQRRPSGCTALESNIRIRPLASDRATYADGVLVCGEYEYHPDDTTHQTITNPAVIIEVLSDSTAEDDRTDKFQHYRLAPTLANYVLIWQDTQCVEVRSRRGDDFVVTTFGPGEIVELSHRIQFTIDELYAR